MSALALQQQALLAAIWQSNSDAAIPGVAPSAARARGLRAYQDHAAMLAPRALSVAYPVTVQLLGEQSFVAMARAFWSAHPPQCGDLACWGAQLADFMVASEALAAEPYLPDVARLEWALHAAATAADAVQDAATLALMVEHDPMRIGVRLAPASAVLRSPWPVVSVLDAHLQSEAPDSWRLQHAGHKLREGIAEEALVWRQGYKPCFRMCLAGEAALLQALLAGHSLGQALALAPDLEFSTWLARAVPDALWLSAHLLEPVS